LIDPKDDCRGDSDCRHEGVGASVIAGVNTPPVPEFSEHILDFMTTAIERFVEVDLSSAI